MSGVGENQYNGLVHNFVSEPLINHLWNDLAKDAIGTTPVTLGTDNWFVNAINDPVMQRPFYNRMGGGEPADMATYFYKNDRIYINDFTLFCNFADGLVKQTNAIVSPANAPVLLDPNLIDYTILNNFRVQFHTYYLQQDVGIIDAATQIFPITHFNRSYDLGFFLVPNTAFQRNRVLQNNIAQWFEIEILTDGDPVYSTKNINTAFQSDICLVWAEATISHTFNTTDYDAVIAGSGSTGWPD